MEPGQNHWNKFMLLTQGTPQVERESINCPYRKTIQNNLRAKIEFFIKDEQVEIIDID